MALIDMILALQENIKAEAYRYYRERSIGILEACNEESAEKKGIVYITDITRQGNKVCMSGLVGSPLYIALHLHRYEEAEQILKSMPRTAEPGYTVRQFRVTFSSVNPDDGEIEFPTGGEVYLEEMLLTDAGLPDSLCIRLWNIWSRRKAEDQPGLFTEERPENTVPLLIREWPGRTKLRRRFGDLQHIDNRWFGTAHSWEEYEPYHEALKADLGRFWEGLKGLYRLRTLDKSLYESLIDERMAAHLMLKLMMILLESVQLEVMLLHTLSGALSMNQPMNPPNYALEKILPLVQEAAKKAATAKMVNVKDLHHLYQLQLTVDGAGALRRLKRGLTKLGFTYIAGDTLWDACMDYHYVVSDQARVFWCAFDIWKVVFEGELHLTMDGNRQERSEQMWAALLYNDGWIGRVYSQSDIYMVLLRYLDGLKWTENRDSKWLEKMRHATGKQILREDDPELLLFTLEKNVLLAEDMDFLWKNCCKEDQLQLKPLLIMKKYGCL